MNILSMCAGFQLLIQLIPMDDARQMESIKQKENHMNFPNGTSGLSMPPMEVLCLRVRNQVKVLIHGWV